MTPPGAPVQAPPEHALAAGARHARPALPPWLLWLSIPLLAVAAYAPVLSLWFVGDDFGHLHFHERLPWPQPFLAFGHEAIFYRPLSLSLTWLLGYALFGTSALPYHALSLVLHALTAWLLGRLIAEVAQDSRIGWLAGALFAVYPLSTEPVAWLAAQWDVWGAVCALAGIWAFAHAWRTRSRRVYVLGILAFLAGVFMKESVLPAPAILPAVAFVIDFGRPAGSARRQTLGWRGGLAWARRALLWTLPYLIPSLLFLGIRLSAGTVGGYPQAATDYQDFFWDSLLSMVLLMLAPLNRSVFTRPLVQAAGLLLTSGVLVGLILWGRKRGPLLGLALVWILLFLLPVLNLAPGGGTGAFSLNTAGNRVLYFSLMGFCLLLAVVLTGLREAVHDARWARWGIAILLLLAVPTTWTQLQPWVQSSQQTRFIVDEVGRLLPPLPGRRVQLNVQNLPLEYKGSYVFLNGFDDALSTFAQAGVQSQPVSVLDPAALEQPFIQTAGIYNLAFNFAPEDQLFHVSAFAGRTIGLPAPPAGGQVWDYTHCQTGEGFAAGWLPISAALNCVAAPQAPLAPGTSYATFSPTSADGNLVRQDLQLDLEHAAGVRLGVCLRFATPQPGEVGEWFWGTPENPTWTQDRSRAFLLDRTGAWRVYWTYLPTGQVGGSLHGLRFDPVNAPVPVDIAWIAVAAIP